MEQIQQLGDLLKSRDTHAILAFIHDNKEVLTQTNAQGISGLVLIAYYQLPEVLSAVIPLKQPLTFYEAVVCGQLEEVKNYISKDASLVHQIATDGFPPLSLACYFGHREVATYLLENGAKVDTVATNGSNLRALHAAIARNDTFMCELLLKNGAAVDAVQAQNVTPLHSAVHRGNLEMAKLLVQYGANLTTQMDNGDTALSIAKREGHTSLLEYLQSK